LPLTPAVAGEPLYVQKENAMSAVLAAKAAPATSQQITVTPLTGAIGADVAAPQ